MSQSKKRAVFLLVMLAAGSIVTLVYLAATGNAPQKYTDIVIEFTSIFSSNKSAERILVYLLVFAGTGIYTLYFLYTLKKQVEELPGPQGEKTCQTLQDSTLKVICLLAALAGVYYVVFARMNLVLLCYML